METNTKKEGTNCSLFNKPLENIQSEEMCIKIQTLDNIFPLIIKRSATVQDLK